MTAGRLLGIARRDRPRGAMEVLERATVSVPLGIHGDFRGAVRPGGKNHRQVTVMSRAAWRAAMVDLGADLYGEPLDWWVRRVNLLVDGVELPREPGGRLHFAGGVVLEMARECDPCSRMDAIRPGLRAALTPDWRGGITTRVLAGGDLAVGDEMRIELP